MKRTLDKTQFGPRCAFCEKGRVSGVNKPHSQKRTKRIVSPNIQSFYGIPACTRCLRTLKSKQQQLKEESQPAVAASVA